jgi:prepilin-type processing-associated H-X9-DG protein
MYSNESKGERMPANTFIAYWNPDQDRNTPPNSTILDQLQTTFSPRITNVYPEYMPDPAILICPSDSSNDLRNATQLNCIAFSDEFPCPGSGNLNDLGSGDVEVGIIGDADDSYTYLGWVFDKGNLTQTLGQNVTGGALSISDILALFLTDDYSAVLAPTQPTQVFERFLNAWISDCLGLTPSSAAQDCINNQADQDWDNITVPTGSPAPYVAGDPYGVGDSDTVYRLREGIERFLITDINNPGASAKAQSQIWIMFDNVATVAAEYNHVPGGSNVLFLDGHVTFVRYPGPSDSPVQESFALFFGTVSQV